MINEDTLTLYYYDDGLSAAERRQVEDALKRDAALATRYQFLCAELQGWQLADDGKMPDHLLHNFHDTIDRAARLERNSSVYRVMEIVEEKPTGTMGVARDGPSG